MTVKCTNTRVRARGPIISLISREGMTNMTNDNRTYTVFSKTTGDVTGRALPYDKAAALLCERVPEEGVDALSVFKGSTGLVMMPDDHYDRWRAQRVKDGYVTTDTKPEPPTAETESRATRMRRFAKEAMERRAAEKGIQIVEGIETPLHERWLYRLPAAYRQHLADLHAHRDQVGNMRKALRDIHAGIRGAKVVRPVTAMVPVAQLDVALQSIEEALVLLECAEDKLVHALPTEAYMDKQSLEDLETGKWRNWGNW